MTKRTQKIVTAPDNAIPASAPCKMDRRPRRNRGDLRQGGAVVSARVQSDTPRTDDECFEAIERGLERVFVVKVDFARELERANEALISALVAYVYLDAFGDRRQELDKLEAGKAALEFAGWVQS